MNGLVLLVLAVTALASLGAALWAYSKLGATRTALALAEERLRLAEGSHEVIRAQAAQSAQVVADQMVARASETFKSQEDLAKARLEAQLKPVAETLAKFEAQVTAMEKARAEDTGGLKAQIAAMLEASVSTQAEARKLSNALRRGAGIQGRWGEQILENVLELSGLKHPRDYERQPSLETEEGRRRPDVTVRMPGGGKLIIDSKCSTTAFTEAQDATDDVVREGALVRHAQSVREHVKALSGKQYWDIVPGSPDIVAMFIPGDGILSAAVERQPDLVAWAMTQRIVIVTPTTLFSLCKIVAYGWRAEDQAQNATLVVELGRDLYKRIAVMGNHVLKLGKSLEDSMASYNQFVGSLETQVMTQAKKFADLAVDHEGKTIPNLPPIEIARRPLAKLAADSGVDGPA